VHSLNSRLKKVRVFSPPHRLSWVSNRAPFSCESRSKPVSTAKNRPFFSDTRDSGRCTASLGFRGPGHGFGFFKDADSNVAPAPYSRTAVGAFDETVICRMVWNDESGAATLTAPERGSVRVRLDWLRHDTASILVGRTTAGEECGASLFSKRSLSRRNRCAFWLASVIRLCDWIAALAQWIGWTSRLID